MNSDLQCIDVFQMNNNSGSINLLLKIKKLSFEFAIKLLLIAPKTIINI